MAEQVQVELEVETKQAEKNVDDLTGGIKNLTKAVEEGNEQTAAGLKSIEETSKTTGEGVKGIGNAIKAAGVGLFLIALESMKELFMQNQQVADAVSGAFEGLALVFNDVFGLLTGGQESVKKLGDAFDKYFGQPIQTATQAFEKFGDAFSKIFGGDFSGALESAKEGFSGLGDAISQTGDGFVEAATDVAEYVVDIKDAAVANVQLAKAAEKAEVINAGLLEKYDRQAEQQRQIRDEERNSITERIAANEKLGKLLEEQNKVMLENANIVLKAAEVAFARNGSLENEIALITAKNEVMAVEATVEGFRSEQKANDLALDRERIELLNTEAESVSNLGFEKRKFDAEQEKRDTIRIEKLKQINAEERISEQARLQAIVDEANIGTQAKVDAQIALDEFMQTSRQESITLDKEYTDAVVAEDQKRIDSKLAAIEAERAAKQAQIDTATSVFSVIAQIAGENAKIQKALLLANSAAGIASIVIDTNAANAAAIAKFSLVPGGSLISAGIISKNKVNAAIGIASTIASTATALRAIGKGGSVASEATIPSPSIGGDSSFESQAPEFNIVGTSGVNQIADVVSSQAPVKAYVVANDVTTAQALDRNIVESATL
jgi:transposase-like protein